jgi:hypothetical protein
MIARNSGGTRRDIQMLRPFAGCFSYLAGQINRLDLNKDAILCA